ncbi:BtrH N-terminal domain-containing protein [Kribbella sp. HUAS MG21]|uniref:BtrH N-terminal domain-containing protein n=1 Tax=Kribbella sp. HUAS MG21 TaxID=3160966 RepID=A0AAU7T8I1_9ACTN
MVTTLSGSAQPFPGFVSYPTHHCVTGSLKHVYDFHGYPISEELLLGLGAGLGFMYFHFKGSDPFYGGRANNASPREEGLEKTAGRRTGVAVTARSTSSARVAETELRRLLEAGEPVLLYVDMGFLPYFDLPDGYHFGGHVVVAAGYDQATGQVLIADRETQLHPVDWAALEKARGSAYRPFPPRHTWYTFDFGSAREPRATDVRTAIAEVCDGMLEPPISNFGVRGIRKAIRETMRWPDTLGTDALRRACFNTALLIDARGGTGGGIFRYLYARFLGEAAVITGEARLDDLGNELAAIGDLWEDVAATFAAAAELDDPADLLGPATTPMHDIADREELLWQSLRTLVRTQ